MTNDYINIMSQNSIQCLNILNEQNTRSLFLCLYRRPQSRPHPLCSRRSRLHHLPLTCQGFLNFGIPLAATRIFICPLLTPCFLRTPQRVLLYPEAAAPSFEKIQRIYQSLKGLHLFRRRFLPLKALPMMFLRPNRRLRSRRSVCQCSQCCGSPH